MAGLVQQGRIPNESYLNATQRAPIGALSCLGDDASCIADDNNHGCDGDYNPQRFEPQCDKLTTSITIEHGKATPEPTAVEHAKRNEPHHAVNHKKILKGQKPHWIVAVGSRGLEYRKMASNQQQQGRRIDKAVPYTPDGLRDPRKQALAARSHRRDALGLPLGRWRRLRSNLRH